MISVTNARATPVNVAINQWGTGGDTNYFALSNKQTETWDRTDMRGFVMSLSVAGRAAPYLVFAGSKVTVGDKNVTIDGEIYPLPSDHPKAQAAA
ncbi:MAG: hypothetical protein JSR61_09875 [Proteobacteria bacterium]|nr:hypothetical protein [Pseudomonadota bacterium]